MSAIDIVGQGIRGWVRPGARRGRWIEPFVLLLVAEQPSHGYSVIGRLDELGLTADGVDVGMVYRTLRELDAEGLVTTEWGLESGPPRREYRLTAEGRHALAEWAAVMVERKRLVEAFLKRNGRVEPPAGG